MKPTNHASFRTDSREPVHGEISPKRVMARQFLALILDLRYRRRWSPSSKINRPHPAAGSTGHEKHSLNISARVFGLVAGEFVRLPDQGARGVKFCFRIDIVD